MAFYDLDMNMDLIESMIKLVIRSAAVQCKEEFELIGRDTTILEFRVNKQFPGLTMMKQFVLSKVSRTLMEKIPSRRWKKSLRMCRPEG
jgi:aspartyl/asparaginyl-tRNA synthetase